MNQSSKAPVLDDTFNFATSPNTSFGQTSVLVRAITIENVKRVNFLLKSGCSPNQSVGDSKIQPLIVACYVKDDAKRLAIFKVLFRYGVNPELKDFFGRNAIMYTCALDLEKELLFILDNFICSFYNRDRYGNTLLHICTKYSTGNITVTIAKKMLSYSMNINVVNGNNYTPLDEAILHKNSDSAQKLYELSARSTLPEFPHNLYKSALGIREGHATNHSALTQCRRQSHHPPAVPNKFTSFKMQRSKSYLNFPKLSEPTETLCSEQTVKSTSHFPKISMPKISMPAEKNPSKETLPSEEMTLPLQSLHVSSGVVPKYTGPKVDSEDILYKLLEIKSSQSTSAGRPRRNAQVPLDDKWKATMQKYYMVEAVAMPCPRRRKSESKQIIKMPELRESSSTQSYKEKWKNAYSLIKTNKIEPKKKMDKV